MLYLALALIILSAVLWILLFILLKIGPRTGSRQDIGGGLSIHRGGSESWLLTPEEEVSKRMSYQDIRLLNQVYMSGGTPSLDELELLTKESTSALASRLSRLEALGIVARTSGGRYEITDYGRRLLEMYKEKLAVKRKDEDLVRGY